MLFSIVLFLAMLIIYGGLSLGYKGYLNRSIKSFEDELDELVYRFTPEQQENLITLYSQVDNLRGLLADHVYGAQLFPILERNTHPRVAYKTLYLSVPDSEVIIEGVTNSYDDLVTQLAIYEAAPEVERLVLGDSSSFGGVVNFKVTLTLADGVLELQQ